MKNLPKSVTICEVGPRDGLQHERAFIPTEKKIELINRVGASGVKVIEVTSFVHPKAVPQMADADIVATQMIRFPGVQYRALAMNLKGVQRAIDAGISHIRLAAHSASESHNLSNQNKSVDESVRGLESLMELAKENGITVSGGIAVAFGCPFEGKIPVDKLKGYVKRLLEHGFSTLSLADTAGMANPLQVYDIVSEMVQTFPDVTWSMHFHDARGMAMANIIAAMEAGVTWFDGAFSGLGGCPYAPGAAGNVATEDVVHMLHEMGIETGIDLDKAIATARLAKEIVGHETDSRLLKAGKACDLFPKPSGQTKIG